ncbi:MAG: FtsX-like permease family protein [Clostridium chrysemydis]|uniref:FtsX-like permease family protein n=1 Tax=Clostridium chrysemydis TaxID=2665504 RepID=UPI003F2D5144
MISIIILLFVSLSIIQFMMNSIQNRKREFGIYILNGGRIVDISKIVLYEIIIYMVVALTVLFAIVNALNIFNLNTTLIIIGLTIVYSFITFLLPYKKIKNFEVKELIKGDE